MPAESYNTLIFYDFDILIEHYNVIYLIITLCKEAIYDNKDIMTQVSFRHVNNIVTSCEKTERYNAIAKSKLQLHLEKWQKYIPPLQSTDWYCVCVEGGTIALILLPILSYQYISYFHLTQDIVLVSRRRGNIL